MPERGPGVRRRPGWSTCGWGATTSWTAARPTTRTARTACTWCPATVAKGLEFDRVVVVEPAAIAAAEPDERTGLRRLYVVLTRAVTGLTVVHAEPLPAPLRETERVGRRSPPGGVKRACESRPEGCGARPRSAPRHQPDDERDDREAAEPRRRSA